MTDAERLVVLLTADAVRAMALNPCAPVDVTALTAARHALDDEAHTLANGTRLAPLVPEPAEVVVRRAEEAIDRVPPVGANWPPVMR